MTAMKKTAAAVEVKETKAAAPAVKDAAPKEAVKAEEPAKKAPAAKTPAAKKAPAKKAAAPVKKAPAAKAPAAKEIKAAVYVQYAGREVAAQDLLAAAKKAYVAAGHKEEDIETINVYVKPEENAAYFAVNGEGSDDFKIEY